MKVHILDEGPTTAYLVLHYAPNLQNWQPPTPIVQKLTRQAAQVHAGVQAPVVAQRVVPPAPGTIVKK
ncbi:MAG TPA: hypothetical protein VMU34_20025 [Mycobacterium sp.]|nr:hypothetical protein [Mycobacterium sp.]